VLSGGAYRERTLRLGRRSGGLVMVLSGLARGERVALKDPTLPETRDAK